MKIILFYLIVVIFLFIIDIYTYKGIKLLTRKISKRGKNIVNYSFWVISIAIYLILAYHFVFPPVKRTPDAFVSIFWLIGFIVLFYLPKLLFIIFQLLEDITHIIRLFINYLKTKINSKNKQTEGTKISRSVFLSRIGLLLAGIPFSSIVYGIIKGRFDFRIRKTSISFKDLPEAFDEFKIVQISDIHIGSFFGHQDEVIEAINLINEQEPDIILFTGDLVNYFSEELEGWIPILSQLKAKYGKISILGNHDYGYYYKWNSPKEREDDHLKLIEYEETIGFKLLNNTHTILEINNQKLFFAGVENWGLPPFPQYGKLNEAMNGISENDFTILLSHDPSHWDAQVLGDKRIKLTFSGHTHGMQMGVTLFGKEWSPAQFKFKQWAGLYYENEQYLYVNRGFGAVGFPGRVGMDPEITVIELKKEKL